MLPVIPNVGKVNFNRLVSAYLSGNPNCQVHLFQNNFSPGPGTVLGSFVECNFSGYGSTRLPIGADLGIDLAGKDVWSFPGVLFQALAPGTGLPQSAYGFWVDVQPGGVGPVLLLWCQTFSVPFLFPSPGTQFRFTISLAIGECLC